LNWAVWEEGSIALKTETRFDDGSEGRWTRNTGFIASRSGAALGAANVTLALAPADARSGELTLLGLLRLTKATATAAAAARPAKRGPECRHERLEGNGSRFGVACAEEASAICSSDSIEQAFWMRQYWS
jgi:hypothetical protein